MTSRPPPPKQTTTTTTSPKQAPASPKQVPASPKQSSGSSPKPPNPPSKKSGGEELATGVAVASNANAEKKLSSTDDKAYESGDNAGYGEKDTQMVALETASAPPEKSPEKTRDPREDKEILWEIKTHNFVLLLAGLLFGMGLGYVIWIFVRKDLIFWVCAILGLVVAKILEEKKFPQNVVRIWSAKVTEEMLKPPKNWRQLYGSGNDFFAQSDMYDVEQNYVRSTAVYHNKNTCALTVRERFVRRSRLENKLSMDTPYGAVVIATLSLAISVGFYLNNSDIGPNLSSAVTCFFVLLPVFFLVGCIIELELRKRRLLAFANAEERVTYIPLHTIGKIERMTYGADHWKMLYIPPMANTKLRRIMRVVKMILLPLLWFFKLILGIFMLATYNGAFAIWIWHCVATIVLYQAHVQKEAEYVEPAMTLLWATFIVNVFEIWYCGPVNHCIDTCGTDPKTKLRKLELDADTRLPREKVRRLVVGFCISLALVFISAVAMSAITNDIFSDVEFVGIDNSWKKSYREHSNLILCKKDEETRRLIYEEMDGSMSLSDPFLAEIRAQTLRGKYESDYDALCSNTIYRNISVSVAFCTINWFFLLFLAMYWHVYDKYQTTMKYEDNKLVWYDFTRFYIHSVPSKIAWLGRIIGRHRNETMWFYMIPKDAAQLYRYLTDNVPWYASLNPNQPGARELMPM